MESKFKPGDLVIAKLRGHASWPAKISRIATKGNSLRFHVSFFVTEQKAECRLSEICHYEENKLVFSKAKSTQNESLIAALKEVEEECNLRKLKRNTTYSPNISRSSNARNVSLTTPIPTQATPTRSHKLNLISNKPSVLENGKEQSCLKSAEAFRPTMADAAVNTPFDIDLDYQVKALTERCITLEKSLIEEKSKNSSDYTLMLEELDKYKSETKNLNTIIETLHNDKIYLENKIKELKAVERCLHCFPPLMPVNDTWHTVNRPVSRPHSSQPQCGAYPECKNRFELLTTNIEEPEVNVQILSSSNTKSPLVSKGANTKPDRPINSNVDKTASNLIILADSHGRHLGRLIQQRTSTVYVCAHVRPGARFDKITEDVGTLTGNFGRKDHLLVIGGTNNIETTGIKRLLDGIHKLISQSKHTNLLLATVPMRHDQPELDLKISTINSEIEKIAESNGKIKILPLHLFPRHAFTTHGLHMNKCGKLQIAKIVSGILCDQEISSPTPAIPTIKLKMKTPVSVKPIVTNGVTVVEAEMKEVIHHFREDPTVALAHTISKDFNDERHMSAGVAVVFRQIFGRPRKADYINNNVTLQKVQNGPSIFSLVTKDVYHGKPSKEVYDSAFVQLQEEFKARNLKTLICSAMGCVRDLIEPQHFVDNIGKFHRETGASVCIVTYPQKARRLLWNGLSHDEFLTTLRRLIGDHQPTEEEEPDLHLVRSSAGSTATPTKTRGDSPARNSTDSIPQSVSLICDDESQYCDKSVVNIVSSDQEKGGSEEGVHSVDISSRLDDCAEKLVSCNQQTPPSVPFLAV